MDLNFCPKMIGGCEVKAEEEVQMKDWMHMKNRLQVQFVKHLFNNNSNNNNSVFFFAQKMLGSWHIFNGWNIFVEFYVFLHHSLLIWTTLNNIWLKTYF